MDLPSTDPYTLMTWWGRLGKDGRAAFPADLQLEVKRIIHAFNLKNAAIRQARQEPVDTTQRKEERLAEQHREAIAVATIANTLRRITLDYQRYKRMDRFNRGLA